MVRSDESEWRHFDILAVVDEGGALQMDENAHNPDEDVDEFENFRLVHLLADFDFALVDSDYTLWSYSWLLI